MDKQMILEALAKNLDSMGEGFPVKLMKGQARDIIKDLEADGSVIVKKGIYVANDPFVFLKNEKYPKDFGELMKLRELVRGGTPAPEAANKLNLQVIS